MSAPKTTTILVPSKPVPLEQIRVFDNGSFVLASFEHGQEMVVNLKNKDPEKIARIMRRVLPR